MRIYRYKVGPNTYYGELISEGTLARCVRLNSSNMELKRAGVEDNLAEVELLTPCAPSKVICVGRNYLEHAKDINTPILFTQGQDNRVFADSNIRCHERLEKIVPGRHQLHVFPGYGHQDVFMGKNVHQDVFPRMIQFLREQCHD